MSSTELPNFAERRKALTLVVVFAVFSGILLFVVSVARRSGEPTATTAGSRGEPAATTTGSGFSLADERVLPGEFERHEALLLCWPDLKLVIGSKSSSEKFARDEKLNASLRFTALEIIKSVRRNIRIVLLVHSTEARRQAEAALQTSNIPLESIQIVEVPHNTVWVRDYGPLVLRSLRGPIWITKWSKKMEQLHPNDEFFSHVLAKRSSANVVEIPIYLDGGNLITNGRRLYLTTTKTLEQNLALGYSETKVTEQLRNRLNAKQVVYLEKLIGEPTGHVDMFATFPSPDTVVLGEYLREYDPVNYEILERNARKLRAVMTPTGPLKVVRIPMAPHGRKVFGGSYTNVVYANGVCLVPQYGTLDPEGLTTAMATYRRLLPGSKVISIDALNWIIQFGSLHCLTLHVHRLPLEWKPNGSARQKAK